MAKLACPCGNVLSNVADPNDVEWTLIADAVLDEAELSGSASAVVDLVYSQCTRVWRCAYGRLALLSGNSARWFRPE